MSSIKKDPPRPLTRSERTALERLARSQSAPAASVARARAILAVSDGSSYTEAAQLVGRAVGDSIAQWVACFNQVGLGAMVPRHSGGAPPVLYGPAARDRILSEFRRQPDREQDGTATWSLNTLPRALRRAADGLPNVSTYTNLDRPARCRYQLATRPVLVPHRCGHAQAKRGEAEVHDPDASAKKV